MLNMLCEYASIQKFWKLKEFLVGTFKYLTFVKKEHLAFVIYVTCNLDTKFEASG